MRRGCRGRGSAGWRAGGFTLIEILSAMAIAVVIMLGVAQVFKMTSEAVSEAEAQSDSYQQARGVLNILQHDFSQQTNEGYFCTVPGVLPVPTRRPTGGIADRPYRFDTLYFTSVGQFDEVGTDVSLHGGVAVQSCAAEIVYTYANRDHTGTTQSPPPLTKWFEYIDWPTNSEGDPRTILLVRKAFLVSGNPSQYNQALPLIFRWTAPYTGGTANMPHGCLAMMMCDRWNDTAASFYPRFRVALPVTLANAQQLDNTAAKVNVAENPMTHGYDPGVSWVVADRVSEFFVEVWEVTQTGAYQWYRPDPTQRPQDVRKLLWCGNAPNCQNWYQRTMPRMIRVTLVVHPHSDTAPLVVQPYAAASSQKSVADLTNKYQGMVFRQVFRVNGLVANNS